MGRCGEMWGDRGTSCEEAFVDSEAPGEEGGGGRPCCHQCWVRQLKPLAAFCCQRLAAVCCQWRVVSSARQPRRCQPAPSHASQKERCSSTYRTTHGTEPTLDSILWRYGTQAVLGLRDASRAFPANSALGVLKWRFLTTEDTHAPLLLTCWRA